jgi:hypothetical protein
MPDGDKTGWRRTDETCLLDKKKQKQNEITDNYLNPFHGPTLLFWAINRMSSTNEKRKLK